ncbi:hypothetical protein F4X86_03760 [Candidatus Saccharibacteria bacterium]|nr:hypothetical protein [Candidatus Saccharibacteria bacterium]
MVLPMIAQIANVAVERPEALPDVTGETLLGGALNMVFLALAGISTIVLVLQGIRYTLSSGEGESVTKARNGIVYALIGIAVATSAWSLINFTLNKVIRDSSHVGENATLTNLFADIAGLIIFIGAVISVIMIVLAAIQLTLSGSSPGSDKGPSGVKKARNRIIYAIIGLVITILAGPILALVLNRL